MRCPKLDNSDHETGWVGSDLRNTPTVIQVLMMYLNSFVHISGLPCIQNLMINQSSMLWL